MRHDKHNYEQSRSTITGGEVNEKEREETLKGFRNILEKE